MEIIITVSYYEQLTADILCNRYGYASCHWGAMQQSSILNVAFFSVLLRVTLGMGQCRKSHTSHLRDEQGELLFGQANRSSCMLPFQIIPVDHIYQSMNATKDFSGTLFHDRHMLRCHFHSQFHSPVRYQNCVLHSGVEKGRQRKAWVLPIVRIMNTN